MLNTHILVVLTFKSPNGPLWFIYTTTFLVNLAKYGPHSNCMIHLLEMSKLIKRLLLNVEYMLYKLTFLKDNKTLTIQIHEIWSNHHNISSKLCQMNIIISYIPIYSHIQFQYMRIPRGILSIPQNIVMDLNNVMSNFRLILSFTIVKKKINSNFHTNTYQSK